MDRRSVLLGLAGSGLTAGCQARLGAEDATGGEWRSGAALPAPLQEIYPALFEGRIHVAGGFLAENGLITGPTDAHFAYDPTIGKWAEYPPLPRPRHHPHLAAFEGHLVAFGGFESPSVEAVWQMQAGGWALPPADSRFVYYPPLKTADGYWAAFPKSPQPVGEAVTSVIQGRLHVAGGRRPKAASNQSWADHIDTDAHFILSTLDGSWEAAAPLPTARNSAAGALIEGSWHVVGGRTVAGGNTGTHEVYDANEDRWRIAAPMPQGQGGLAATSLAVRLYAFGGEYFEPEPGGVYREAWCYTPPSDSWQQLPDMPSPRHGLGAVTVDRDIYVVGGALGVGGRNTSALVEIFTPI